jgi:hypothetical protein
MWYKFQEYFSIIGVMTRAKSLFKLVKTFTLDSMAQAFLFNYQNIKYEHNQTQKRWIVSIVLYRSF